MRYLSSIFTLVKKYLINLWVRDSSELITRIEWEWENNKEQIEIELQGYVIDYEIIKLTKNELILEDKSGIIFEGEIELEKI